MKKFFISLLLLAIINLKITHANNDMDRILENDMNTKKMNPLKALHHHHHHHHQQQQHNNGKKSRIIKRSVSGPSSVVQDWNLVCNELCGAGLGGPICGPQCNKNKFIDDTRTKSRASQVLGQNKNILCSVLCSSDLGDPLCMCPMLSDVNSNNNNNNNNYNAIEYNIICSSFCDYNNVTLSGCSPCLNRYDNQNNNLNINLLITEESAIDNNLNNNREQERRSVYLHNVIDGMTIIPTSITTTTTVATPNWDKICIDLCKKGDGGALCNCDLPPFF